MTREKVCGIYKIENLVNGKVYIGQSADMKRRWSDHKRMFNHKDDGSLKYNYPLYCAFRKYGEQNFSFEIIEECDEEELNEKEICYIKKYNSYVRWNNSNGYNQTIGGESNYGESNPAAKIVYCEGKEFGCVKDCAEYYDVGVSAMRSWLNKERPMPKEFFDKNLHALGDTMDDYKIQVGNSGENNIKSIPVYCEYMVFSNVRECAEYYNINSGTMRKWLDGVNDMPEEWYNRGLHKEGMTMENYTIQKGALTRSDNPNSKALYCDGIRYECAKDFVEENNLIYSTVMNWLNKYTYMPQEWYDRGLHLDGEAMSEYKVQTGMPKGKDNKLSKPVICEGITFESIMQCEDYYGINRGRIGDWISGKHKMPKEWYDRGLRAVDKTMSDYEYYEEHGKILCDEDIFDSLDEFCSKHNLSKGAVKSWLNHGCKMPKEWYDRKLHYEEETMENYEWTTYKPKRRVVCENITYESAEKFARQFDLKTTTLNCWLTGKRAMPDKWYDKGLRYEDKTMDEYIKRSNAPKKKSKTSSKKVFCDNMVFNSIKECANYYKLSPETIGKWLSGYNPMPQNFINKGLKYYKEDDK